MEYVPSIVKGDSDASLILSCVGQLQELKTHVEKSYAVEVLSR